LNTYSQDNSFAGNPTMAEKAAEDASEHDLRHHQGGQRMGLPSGNNLTILMSVLITMNLMTVEEVKGVCKVRSKWKEVISAYPKGKWA
jgi:hypothetical protein